MFLFFILSLVSVVVLLGWGRLCKLVVLLSEGIDLIWNRVWKKFMFSSNISNSSGFGDK